ncbi:hypothetical protein [Streptomyces sp. NRRL F-5650]|uniref:hypothetical protein n=1 Tax=Streptomyces sp. NRRL F-5650 TaxID=1463868 RepID=UPI0004C897F4|nr:hypothetical protein [Streptomyces sp. NRRL F-5650]
MTEQTTELGSLGYQGPALGIFARLAEVQPTLPDAYLVFSGSEVMVQLDSVPEVEAWREALHVAPQDVVLNKGASRTYLEFFTRVSGVAVHAYTTVDIAQPEQEGAAA